MGLWTAALLPLLLLEQHAHKFISSDHMHYLGSREGQKIRAGITDASSVQEEYQQRPRSRYLAISIHSCLFWLVDQEAASLISRTSDTWCILVFSLASLKCSSGYQQNQIPEAVKKLYRGRLLSHRGGSEGSPRSSYDQAWRPNSTQVSVQGIWWNGHLTVLK